MKGRDPLQRKDEFSKGKEWRLYEYVTRHFIASLMDDAEYDEMLGHKLVKLPCSLSPFLI